MIAVSMRFNMLLAFRLFFAFASCTSKALWINWYQWQVGVHAQIVQGGDDFASTMDQQVALKAAVLIVLGRTFHRR